jgi:hypothetical protein
MDNQTQDASAGMEKLLRNLIVFDDPEIEEAAKRLEDQAVDQEKQGGPQIGTMNRHRAEFYRKNIKGAEIHKLTYRGEWVVKLDVRAAAAVAKDYEPAVKQAFLQDVYLRSFVKACLRVPKKGGKVALLTDDDASNLDELLALAIFTAYNGAFVLTADELPKAPAPPSTSS